MKATVRGFIYQGSNGEWVLSQEPNLKSCCVNSPAKKDAQIILEGVFEPQNRALNITGSLKVVDGRLHLSNASIESGSQNWGWILPLIICGVCLVVWMGRKMNIVHLHS